MELWICTGYGKNGHTATRVRQQHCPLTKLDFLHSNLCPKAGQIPAACSCTTVPPPVADSAPVKATKIPKHGASHAVTPVKSRNRQLLSSQYANQRENYCCCSGNCTKSTSLPGVSGLFTSLPARVVRLMPVASRDSNARFQCLVQGLTEDNRIHAAQPIFRGISSCSMCAVSLQETAKCSTLLLRA